MKINSALKPAAHMINNLDLPGLGLEEGRGLFQSVTR